MFDLFETIRQEQPRVPGWCTQVKAMTLASLVVGLRPSVSTEIGVYGGSSLIPLLLAHKWIGSGLVYAIEPWDREEAMKVQTTTADVEWWSTQDYAKLFDDFMALVKRLGVQDYLRLIRKPSKRADPMPGCSLMHLDGGHDASAIQDVVRFAPHVVVGGVAVLDDLEWQGGAVTRAALRLEQLGFKKLYPLETGGVWQRVR